jgi:hypothetical protein
VTFFFLLLCRYKLSSASDLLLISTNCIQYHELVSTRYIPAEAAASSAVCILTIPLLTIPCSSALMASPVLPAARYPAKEKVKPPPRITISEPRTR